MTGYLAVQVMTRWMAGSGTNTLSGFTGADTFVLEADGAATLTADVITDYSSADSLTFSPKTSGKNLWFEKVWMPARGIAAPMIQ